MIANIGERGADRRRKTGVLWAIVAVVALIAMMALHAPRGVSLYLAIPIGLAANGFLQAREKT